MKLTRRQFLKSALTTGAVVALPIGGEWAEAAAPVDITTGVEHFGNGWYRCWMTFKEGGDQYMFSSFTKRMDTNKFFRMTAGDRYATFNVEDGTVAEVGMNETYKDEGHKFPEYDLSLAGSEPWGVQLEKLPCHISHTTTYVPTATPSKSALSVETPRTNRIAHSVAHSCDDFLPDLSRASSSAIGLRSNPEKLFL